MSFFGIFTGVGIATLLLTVSVVVCVRRRAGAKAEVEHWSHAAQLSAVLVRDPAAAGRPAVQVHNAGSADVDGVTLVVLEVDTGITHVSPEAHILSPGYEVRLAVPAWATTADRRLFVRFTDARDVVWERDVATGTLREALMVGGRR